MKTFAFTVEIIIEAETEAEATEEYFNQAINLSLYDYEVQELETD